MRKIGSVGKPVSIVAARIVDDDMKDVAAAARWARSSTAARRSWPGTGSNPEATAEAFRGGWFHSGDLVRADEDGFLFVVDRKKDMIITGGENVYCAEVENALSAHPAVAELAVIGAPHERWGETPVAVAVLAPGASLTLDELREWGTARLARYKLPTVLHIVDALPRNASGKVMKTPCGGSTAEGASAGHCGVTGRSRAGGALLCLARPARRGPGPAQLAVTGRARRNRSAPGRRAGRWR